MASDSMELRFTLTPAEVRGFRRFVLLRTWPLLAWVLVGFLAVFLSNLFQWQLYFLLLDLGLSEDAAGSLQAFIPGMVLLIVLVVLLLVRRRQEKKRSHQRGRPVYLEQRWTVSSDGIRVVRDGMSGEAEWRAITAIRQRKDVTYIYMDTSIAYIVPARAFASRADFESFNRTVQSYFKAAHPEVA